jgi:hypothetical protein
LEIESNGSGFVQNKRSSWEGAKTSTAYAQSVRSGPEVNGISPIHSGQGSLLAFSTREGERGIRDFRA